MSLNGLPRGIMEMGCQYWLCSVVVHCEMGFFGVFLLCATQLFVKICRDKIKRGVAFCQISC